MRSSGLGRGLSALIPNAGEGAGVPAPVPPSGGVLQLVVPPGQIHPNPMQPRREFTETELDALAASLKEHGLLQPLVVTRRADGSYELIAGERRLRAAKRAGLVTVPVIVREGETDARRKLELAIVENVQRQDLNPIDRALAYAQLAQEFGLTQEEVAQRVSVSRTSVAHALRLLTLPEDMRRAVATGTLSEGHAKVLLGMADEREQRAWFERILAGGVPVAEVAREARSRTPRGRRARNGAAPLTTDLRAKELALQRRLSARVRIAPGTDGGGTITIAYTDAEELNGIVERMGAT